MKVGIFADIENVVEVFQNLNWEVRFDELLRFIEDTLKAENKTLWKAVAFVPVKRGDKRREGLVDALSFQGWRVITKLAKRQPSGILKANMDIEMVIEIIQTSEHLDEVVLITGDGDFAPLVDFLSNKGKRVWVIGTRKGSVSLDLIRAADKYTNITDITDIKDENGEPLYKILKLHVSTYDGDADKDGIISDYGDFSDYGEEEFDRSDYSQA